MGFKKYDSAAEEQKAELEKQQIEDEKSSFSSMVEENNKEIEELEALPLDEIQESITKRIEESRETYLSYTKKQKKLSGLISAAVLLVMVGALVLMVTLSAQFPFITYISLAIMIVALGGTFFSTKVFRKKLSVMADLYINTLYKEVNNYLFKDSEKFSELDCKPNGQMKDEIFMDARFYKNLKGTKSRNLVAVNYKGNLLGIADLAGNVLVKNRLSPMFLGKIYDYPNTYANEGKRIIVQVKGGELSRPVDDIDDLQLVDGTKTYAVYTNDENYKKVLSQKVLDQILKLKVDKTLIDVIVSIRPGKTCIGIDYVDEFLNIPVQSKFDFNNVKRQESDLNKVLNILDNIH